MVTRDRKIEKGTFYPNSKRGLVPPCPPGSGGTAKKSCVKILFFKMNLEEADTLRNFYPPVNFPCVNWITYLNQID